MKHDDYKFVGRFDTYGKAFRKTISRNVLITLLVVLCFATPCTNWIIPFSKKIIKKDLNIIWRY